jgi:integrase
VSTPPEQALVPPAPLAAAPFAGELALEAEHARAFAAASMSSRTRETYELQWRLFVAWCRPRGLQPLPAAPETVALYLSALATRQLAAATIELALVAISQVHKVKGHPSPRAAAEVQAVRKGIRRTLGTRQKQKAPLLSSELRPGLEAAARGASSSSAPSNEGPKSNTGPEGDLQAAAALAALRDRALLLLGWHGALRRSELVAVAVDHVRFVPQGLELTIPRSKTDQQGAGRVIPIARARAEELCPDRVLRAWLAAAEIASGPVLRGIDRWGHVSAHALCGRTVARVVKRFAALAGLDPDDFGGHSLRAGLVTEAARQGRSELAIMRITGHCSLAMLKRYIREADRWRGLASAGLLDG